MYSISTSLTHILDPSTLLGQLLQSVLQIIAWYFIFNRIKSHLQQNYRTSSWYIQAASKGDGETEFLLLMTAIPHHTISAIFIWLGYHFHSLQLFTMGTLAEFALEFLESISILSAVFIHKNCAYKPQMVISLMCHHLGGLLVIIPTNLYYGTHPQIQMIVFSLLAVAPIGAVFFALYKTRNVNDLQQRGQFTVYMFCGILVLFVARFVWSPLLIWKFVRTEFVELSLALKCMFVVYMVLIHAFNITFTLILCQRLYEWLYGGKGKNRKNRNFRKFKTKDKSEEAGLSTMPRLQRGRSMPLHFELMDRRKKYN